jgi:hypothetical protein
MTSLREGELVTVADERGDRDGIVFHIPSKSKVVVAIPDAGRGAVMRTVHPRTLTARTEAGTYDEALRALIRRTPSPGQGQTRGQSGPGRGLGGHSRSPAHRATGR